MEDWRSRDHFWDLQRYAHEFFTRFLPFHEMSNADALTDAPDDFVFAKPGRTYAVYLPHGGSAELDLSSVGGAFEVSWYDPRHGGDPQAGSVTRIRGGGVRSLGEAPNEPAKDWAVLIRRSSDAGGADASALEGVTRLSAKLSDDVGSSTSRPGDRVRAAVYSPEQFLGASLTGAVDEVAAGGGGTLRITFRALEHRGETLRVVATVRSFVNSKGHRLVDERGRPVRVVEGTLISEETDFAVNEGAELRLEVSPR